MGRIAVVYGFTHTEQMAMPAIVWRRYYALLARREAERNLAHAQVAMLPHLKAEDARSVLGEWREIATAPLRKAREAVGDSWDSIRAWFRTALGDANRE